MREADVGSPSADTGRAISDHRISCPGLIWRRGSQSLMGNFGGSNRSSRWHWHQPRKGRCSDTDDHLSVRANVFRVAHESGHAETEAPCPKCANSRRDQTHARVHLSRPDLGLVGRPGDEPDGRAVSLIVSTGSEYRGVRHDQHLAPPPISVSARRK